MVLSLALTVATRTIDMALLDMNIIKTELRNNQNRIESRLYGDLR